MASRAAIETAGQAVPLNICNSFVISSAMYNRLQVPAHSDRAIFCYDIDLDAPPIQGVSLASKECIEADNLTPTLLTHGGLGEYHVTVDGNDVMTPDTGVGAFTALKSRSVAGSSNSDSDFEDLSDESATSYEGWDMELDLGQCVRYADVHMARSVSDADKDNGKEKNKLQDIPTENEDKTSPVTCVKIESVSPKTAKRMLKRPKNGFIRFAMQYRKQVAANHPRLDNRDISRILGIRWRKLTAEEKAQYEVAFHEEMTVRKTEHPDWRYGGARHHEDIASWEPIPTRLRPRDKIKRLKIPKLTRPYTKRRSSVIQTNWVQCDRCDKWRQLPHGVDMSAMPPTWYCEYNWPPKNHCDADEDQEDPEEKLLTQQIATFKEEREDNDYRYTLNDFVSF